MRVFQIICVVVVIGTGWTWMPAVAQAQAPSVFLTVEKVILDSENSSMRVIVKNVGERKITGCALLAGSRQFTQEFFYSIGVDPKLPISRPAGFGGIRPGESVELFFPSGQGGALTAEVNAVVFEDGTAAGDEAQIASIFRGRLAYASEWARWALIMQEDPSQIESPAARDAERAEMIRILPEDPDERGDAATVAGRMAARRALGSLLAQAQTERNRAALQAYVQERAVVLQQHAQRAGGVASFGVAVASNRNASVKPGTSEVRMDEFSCRYPGQLLGIAGYADVLGGTAQGGSTAKLATLSVAATGACGFGSPVAAISVPACKPEFFTTASLSPSSATITGVSYSYVQGLGCTIMGSQAATTVVTGMDADSKLATSKDSERAACAVQIPTSLTIVSGTDSTTQEGTCVTGGQTGCGVTRTFTYQVLDQDGQPINRQMPFYDTITTGAPNSCYLSQYTTTCPNNSGPCGVYTDANGRFSETLYICAPACYSGTACTTGCTTAAAQTWRVDGNAILKSLTYQCNQVGVN